MKVKNTTVDTIVEYIVCSRMMHHYLFIHCTVKAKTTIGYKVWDTHKCDMFPPLLTHIHMMLVKTLIFVLVKMSKKCNFSFVIVVKYKVD